MKLTRIHPPRAPLAPFFDRLEQTEAGWQYATHKPPAELTHLRALCEARELAGRDIFGDAYLTRDNIAEAFEELADAMNYLAFEAEKVEQAGADPEWDLILTAAGHLVAAYGHLVHLRQRYRGAP